MPTLTPVQRRANRIVRSAFCYRLWQFARVFAVPALAAVVGCQSLGPAAKLDQAALKADVVATARAEIDTRMNAVTTAQADLDARVGTLEATFNTNIGGGGDSISLWLSVSGNIIGAIMPWVSYPIQRGLRLRRERRTTARKTK